MNFRVSSIMIAGAVILLVATGAAQAAVIYDNGAVPLNLASTSDAIGLVRADDFMLAAGATTITGIEWTGRYAQDLVHLTDNFTIQFFINDPANPPTQPVDQPQDLPLFITSMAAGNNVNRTVLNSFLFHYSVALAPLSLSPNTRYWVSIFNDASDEVGTPVWAWGATTAVTAADIVGIRNQSDIWGSGTGFKQDFQLTGDTAQPIPEARATAWLWATAFVMLAGSRQLRQGRGKSVREFQGELNLL